MTFIERTSKSIPFEETIVSDLTNWNFDVSKNGSEHTHINFVKKLQQSEDATSIMIRYTPDLIIAYGEIPHSAYLEIKNSITIEKNAYANYMRLVNNGANVFIVIRSYENTVFARIENLKLFIGRNKHDFTIDNDGWIAPRLDPNKLKIAIANGFRGSGTPFKIIDTANLIEWNKLNFFLEFNFCNNLGA